MNRKTKINIIIVIIVVCVIFINKFYLDRDRDRGVVINDYGITTGVIINFLIISDVDHHYITYEYDVKGYKYQREVSYEYLNLDYMYNNLERYKATKFLVLYSKQDYSKSLINLRNVYEMDTIPTRIDDVSEFK